MIDQRTQPLIDWSNINTVLLDMDGTLLDLHYDNHFWREHVPRRFAEKNRLSIEQAKERLFVLYKKVEGTLDWYCVDYWSDQLALDIPLLKEEVDHLIAVHPHVVDFLSALKATQKRCVLVTNAHGKSLTLKMNRTRLAGYFDNIVCAHDLGFPKETQNFWHKLQLVEPFEAEKTALVDDSIPILDSGSRFGIKQLFSIRKPDSKGPDRNNSHYAAISGFNELLPIL